MGAIQWATLEVFTSWVREMAPMSIFFGGIIAACARMANGNKWRRANVKKCIRDLGILQWQADNFQQRSRSLRNTKRIKGVNKVHITESSSGIKEVKEMVEGFSRQITSLTTAKSSEPHDHDSYSDQANVIGVMRKPSNYNPYSNTYNPGWREHPKFSWSQGF